MVPGQVPGFDTTHILWGLNRGRSARPNIGAAGIGTAPAPVAAWVCSDAPDAMLVSAYDGGVQHGLGHLLYPDGGPLRQYPYEVVNLRAGPGPEARVAPIAWSSKRQTISPSQARQDRDDGDEAYDQYVADGVAEDMRDDHCGTITCARTSYATLLRFALCTSNTFARSYNLPTHSPRPQSSTCSPHSTN